MREECDVYYTWTANLLSHIESHSLGTSPSVLIGWAQVDSSQLALFIIILAFKRATKFLYLHALKWEENEESK